MVEENREWIAGDCLLTLRRSFEWTGEVLAQVEQQRDESFKNPRCEEFSPDMDK